MSKSDEIQDLREKFEPGDIPTSDNFNKLIDMATNADYTDGGTLAEEYLPDNLTLTSFSGDGSGLTHLNATHITSGQINEEQLPSASETAAGALRIATQEQVVNEAATNVAVTPATLGHKLTPINVALNAKADITYVDDQIINLEAGLKFKQDVALVSDIEIGDAMVNGGLIQIDGVKAQEGDRVLLTAQPFAQDNRVWIAREISAWEIAEDFDENPISEISMGTSVEVQQGSKYINSIWTVSDITMVGVGGDGGDESAELTWRKRNDINNYTAGAGIHINNNSVAVDKTWLEQNTLSEDRFNNTHLPSHIDLSQGGTVTGSQIKAERFIGDGSQITHIASENLPSIPNGKLELITANNAVNQSYLPKASTSETGIIKLATAGEAKQGTAETVAISPSTFASAAKLEHHFIFAEDTGQTITLENIPDGKILALYTDVE